MSLQVWLPLNGDLKNLGLSDALIITPTVATFDNAGKIGKCLLYNNKVFIPATEVASIFNNEHMSITFWYNNNGGSTSDHSICGFLGNLEGDSGAPRIYDFFQYPNKNDFHWSMGTLGDGVLNGVIPDNTWIHVCVIYNSGNLKIYINGILNHDSSGHSSAYTFNKSYYINFGYGQKLNDFRIYDHALSVKEVKEIAKGLVLHYPLNNGGRGNPNILSDFDTSFLSYNNGTVTLFTNQMNGGTQEIVSNTYGAIKCLHLHSLGGSNRQFRTKSLELGKTYTISADYYSLNAQNIAWRGELNGGNYSWAGSNDVAYTTPGKWLRLSYTYTNLTSNTVIYFFILCAQNQDCYVKNIKIEEGDKATPWIPNESDPLYAAAGYASGIVYDCSGYQHNGIETGAIVGSADTPRYRCSTNITNNSSHIKIDNLLTSGFNNSYSFSWWGKISSFSERMFWGFSNGIRLNGVFNGNLWNTGDSSSNPLYVPGTTTLIAVPSVNTWHHYVMTGDGISCKLYLDGEYYGIAKTYKSISGTTIYINGWDNGTSYSGQMYISDFRIYCTVLSAADVKALYTDAGYVDKNSNFHAYEFVEE